MYVHTCIHENGHVHIYIHEVRQQEAQYVHEAQHAHELIN
jgi:hypothetical protein